MPLSQRVANQAKFINALHHQDIPLGQGDVREDGLFINLAFGYKGEGRQIPRMSKLHMEFYCSFGGSELRPVE